MSKESPQLALDLLAKHAVKKQHGPICAVRKALEQLPPETAQVMRDALDDDDTYSQPGIAEVFGKLGYKVPEFTVGKHRRRECACDRSAAAT